MNIELNLGLSKFKNAFDKNGTYLCSLSDVGYLSILEFIPV